LHFVSPLGLPVRTEELLAGGIFLAIYALIVTERIHRTLAALLGAVVVIALGLISQHEAFSAEVVDFNVIFLLAGMMIIANILGKTGLFQWLAVEAVRRAEGRPYRLLVLISLITAVASAFLDNVTTVVLMTPVTFFIAQRLGASPAPFLISEILASNIGGTATLIGDPPNIIIGSRLGKDFGDFLVNAGPVAVVALVAYLLFARWLFRRDLAAARDALEPEDIERLVAAERRIEDPHLMRLGLAVLGATIVGFLLARPLGLEGATIALAGAVVLMILAKEDVHEVLKTVEWPTLLFFVGLFILVGAVVKSGLISDLAKQALAVTGGRTDLAAMLVLWMSAVLSAIVDNIPYTITMVPLVQELGQTMDIEPLIWALVIGADFGGNATIVGASANVVVSSMSEARGHPITFRGYLRYGVPATILTMIVGTLDIWLRYFVFR
jgi:Na+/H+ antiporter NhaD/arsenite permease-like protein